MPIDDLSGELITTTRDQERDKFLRDYTFHDPASDTVEGTQPWIDASTAADAMMPLYSNIEKVAQAQDPNQIAGNLLRVQAEADGVFKLGAVGAAGAVVVQASVGGGTIFLGDEITSGGLRFQCSATALYNDGDEVPIAGVDTGPATNLPAGSGMSWTSPRPGIIAAATVAEQTDGSGLSGGRDIETDDEYRTRWLEQKAEPPASGNDAEIIALIESTLSVPVQKGFVHPAILGPGTTTIVFTIKPDTSGSSRIPNPTQLAAVLANVVGEMPGDEGIFSTTLIAQPTNIVLKISWAAIGWSDLVTFPAYYVAGGQAVVVDTVASPTSFVLKSANASYVGIVGPSAGQTLAFYDQTFATFRRKRILTVGGGGPWTITCDTTNGSSDLTYSPAAGTRAMPWSDSLQSIVTGIQTYFQTLGPGEQVASFFDPGVRQRRQPESPGSYPSALTTRGLENAIAVTAVFDAQVLEPTLPLASTVGTPGTSSYLIEMQELSVFPL